MAKLPGPWIDTVPGMQPSAGIDRPDLEYNSWSEHDKIVPDNGRMDVVFPSPTGGQASRGNRR